MDGETEKPDIEKVDLTDLSNYPEKIKFIDQEGNIFELQRFGEQFILTVKNFNSRTGKETMEHLFKFDQNFEIVESIGDIKRGSSKEAVLFEALEKVFRGYFDTSVVTTMPGNTQVEGDWNRKPVRVGKKVSGKGKVIEVNIGLEEMRYGPDEGLLATLDENCRILDVAGVEKKEGSYSVVGKWTSPGKERLATTLEIWAALDSLKCVQRNQFQELPEVVTRTRAIRIQTVGKAQKAISGVRRS